MGSYKYPYIPKEYYPAVMYACSNIRKYKTFHWAVNAATKKYGVDAEKVAKYVRERQGAGQKGKSRSYKFYVVCGWSDEWVGYPGDELLWSQADPQKWRENRRFCGKVIRAMNEENMRKQIPHGHIDNSGRMSGWCLTNAMVTEFSTKQEAEEYLIDKAYKRFVEVQA